MTDEPMDIESNS
jgi:hypothetical protein